MEILKSMTTVIEPTEDSYRQVYDGAIHVLQSQANQELQNLLLLISGKVTALFKLTNADQMKT